MQEKKNKRLFISLIGLIILTGIIFWKSNQEKNFNIDKDIFRVADFKTIDRILLESSDGKVELSSNGARWKVNQQYDADPDMIRVLFATLQQAEPKRRVAASQQYSLESVLKNRGIRLS